MRGPLELLATFDAVAPSDNTSYIVSAELRILRTNPAWERFARANGGEAWLERWQRSGSLLDAIPADLRPFYVRGFERAAATGDVWTHDYECSSPDEYRVFRMTVYPFGGTFLVTHALLVHRAHDREAHPPSDDYARDGLITMCAHCRRVRSVRFPMRWDWVPSYVTTRPPNLSHGLCEPCARYYYPDAAPR